MNRLLIIVAGSGEIISLNDDTVSYIGLSFKKVRRSDLADPSAPFLDTRGRGDKLGLRAGRQMQVESAKSRLRGRPR